MKILLTVVFSFLSIYYMCAQNQADMTAVDYSAASYFNAAGNHASIYSGREEPKYIYKSVNHPYLDEDKFIIGTLCIDSCIYQDIPMRLNQDIEELAVLSPDRIFSVLIPREYLDYAKIDSLHIVYHKPVSADGRLMPEGYYVRMYDGERQVWKRNVSFLSSRVNNNEVEYMFEGNTKIYIHIDGVYHPVNNKRSVLKLFASRKKELKKMFKQSGVKYRENLEKSIVAITRYYDEINK